MFLTVSSFKENFKTQTSKSSRKNVFTFFLNLPPRSHIDLSHFRKIAWLLVCDRVECCIANTVFKYWNGMVREYLNEKFKPSLYRYSMWSQMPLDIPLRKTSTRQKSLSFSGPKISSKMVPSIKNVTILSSFMHALKKNILLHLQS